MPRPAPAATPVTPSAARPWRPRPVATLFVLATLVAARAGDDLPQGPGAALAQAGPSQAYELVATWPGQGGVVAPQSMLHPAGMDATADALYVADTGNDRVDVLGYDGFLKLNIGRPGAGAGELSQPRDVAVDGGTLHVADRGNDRVAAFDLAGQALGATVLPDEMRPWGVAAAAGRVYVTVAERGLVLILAQGREVARFEPGGEPLGIDVAADGTLWLADGRTGSLRHFTADGAPLGAIAQPNPDLAPRDLSVDDNGDLYVQSAGAILWYRAGTDRSQLAMYMEGMAGVAHWPRKGVFASIASVARTWHGLIGYSWQPRSGDPIAVWPRLGFPEGGFGAPHAIHAAPDGRIWLLDRWPRLQVFSPAGQFQSQLVPTFTPNRRFEPVDVAVSSAGEPWVVEHRWIHRLATDGRPLQSARMRSGVTEHWGTAIAMRDAGRRLSVLDSAAPTVRQYGITTTLLTLPDMALQDPSAPWSLWWDIAAADDRPDGRLYAAHRGRSEVVVFEAGAIVATWPMEARPKRVAVGPGGEVFVLGVDGLVSKRRPDGTLLAVWDAGAFATGASDIADLTVDAQGRVYTVDRLADRVQVWALDPDAAPQPVAPRQGGCRVAGDKSAAPSSVVLGQEAVVSLSFGGRCPDAGLGADIVLAIDRSFSMSENGKMGATIQAAVAFADAVDLSRDRLGLVSFNNTAVLAQPLTADLAAVRQAIQALQPSGGTNIAQAIQTGTAELLGPRGRPGYRPVLIVLTDGKDDDPDAVLRMAEAAKAAGVRLFTIGFGDVDPMIMVRAASSPEDNYYAPDTGTLGQIYAEIARRLVATVLARSVTLRDELPSDMRYAGPSAGPTAQVNGQVLSWQLADVPFGGVTMAYRVLPQRTGRRDTNVEAVADYVDGLDQTGSLRYPVPWVEVLSQAPTATNTPTPRPTFTPRPTATATSRPAEPIYLPLLLFQRCLDKTVHADVILAIDTSGSMAQPSGDGQRTRLQAAAQAAHQFGGLLLAEQGNRAGLVTFDSGARLITPLTGDAAALGGALGALQTAQGTRIDLGLVEATAELTGPRGLAGNNKVIVLLTDGRVDIDPQLVVDAAADARAKGIVVVAVGLGGEAEVDFALLGQVASGEANVFKAPTTADLERIYSRIAYTIRCPNLEWP